MKQMMHVGTFIQFIVNSVSLLPRKSQAELLPAADERSPSGVHQSSGLQHRHHHQRPGLLTLKFKATMQAVSKAHQLTCRGKLFMQFKFKSIIFQKAIQKNITTEVTRVTYTV
ncbi:hypothetical protein ILYODFUR_021746 [Ilyodon furcidens]|uniref:Secreted protein n=1 Tax=Ilyodon furcidens TaxID=33524 RepID=A0ABV0UA08_9TELE